MECYQTLIGVYVIHIDVSVMSNNQQYQIEYTANPQSFAIPVSEHEDEELYKFYVKKHTDATTRFIVNLTTQQNQTKLYRTFVSQLCEQMIKLDGVKILTDLQFYIKAYKEGHTTMIPNKVGMIFHLYNTHYLTVLSESLDSV